MPPKNGNYDGIRRNGQNKVEWVADIDGNFLRKILPWNLGPPLDEPNHLWPKSTTTTEIVLTEENFVNCQFRCAKSTSQISSMSMHRKCRYGCANISGIPCSKALFSFGKTPSSHFKHPYINSFNVTMAIFSIKSRELIVFFFNFYFICQLQFDWQITKQTARTRERSLIEARAFPYRG